MVRGGGDMWEKYALYNDLCMREGVVLGHHLASSWLHAKCDDPEKNASASAHYREQFVLRHLFHAVHDRGLTFEDLLLHGYTPGEGVERNDVCSCASRISWDLDATNTIFALGRALCILNVFSAGGVEALNGCDVLHLCPSHSFFYSNFVSKSPLCQALVYVPCILPTNGFASVHHLFWLPFMEKVRDYCLLNLQNPEHKLLAPFSEYKNFGFDFDPCNSANFMTRYLFILLPSHEATIALRLDTPSFNRVFLRKLLSRDSEDVCPITLSPVQELRFICYCRHCYNRFDPDALSRCDKCPLCREELP